MARYIDADDLIRLIEIDGIGNFYYSKSDAVHCVKAMPTADVAPKSEVAREIEEFEKKVGKIYNHYVFEDTDYSDDDVAVEAAMNALNDVLNELAELKKKYPEGKEGEGK